MEGENGDRGQEGAEQRWRQERKKARGDPRPLCPAGEPMTGGQGHARGRGLRDTKGKQRGVGGDRASPCFSFPICSARQQGVSPQDGSLTTTRQPGSCPGCVRAQIIDVKTRSRCSPLQHINPNWDRAEKSAWDPARRTPKSVKGFTRKNTTGVQIKPCTEM